MISFFESAKIQGSETIDPANPVLLQMIASAALPGRWIIAEYVACRSPHYSIALKAPESGEIFFRSEILFRLGEFQSHLNVGP